MANQNFGERGGNDIVAHGGGDGEVAVLAKRMDAAARAVGVALILADIHHQARIESTAVEAVGEAEPQPVRMLAGDGMATDEDLGLHRAGIVDKVDAAALRLRRSRELLCGGFLSGPVAKSFFDGFQHGLRIEIADEHQ